MSINSTSRPSLSASNGLGNFPLHTDGAHLRLPPRYLILGGHQQRTTKSLVLDCSVITHVSDAVASKALFRVGDTAKAFYSRFKESNGSAARYRYNSDVMSPINSEANEIADLLKSAVEQASIVDWSSTKYAVIDNGRCLHGRGPVSGQGIEAIRRLTVW